MDLNKINETQNILGTSPLRDYLKNKKKISFFEEEMEELEGINQSIESSKENLNNILKIVVLGEVKAGKSTLINCLIGKKVSYTNVVEATSAILEINYSINEKIIIKKNKGDTELVSSLKELDALILKNKDNKKFFENIEKISILTNTERLKEVAIVDTPGLNTVTNENEKRTEDYIKNADVILWVLNCHHLGQSDVSEKLDEVSTYGKPMICIINRVDESDSDEDRLIEYVEDEMGGYFDKVFATSAKLAWEGHEQNDIVKKVNSNIEDLYSYILDNIEKKADDVQLKSVSDSINVQIKRDLNIHKIAKLRIKGVMENIDRDIDDFRKFNRRIKDNITTKIDSWIDMEFFNQETRILANTSRTEDFNRLVKSYCENTYLEKIINEKYQDVNNYISNEWQNNVKNFTHRQDLNKLKVESEIDSTSIVSDKLTEDDILSGVKQSGATAGAVGLGLAGYAAWLGPASAYVTIGTAISTIMAPVLIVGVIGGVVWKFMNKEKRNDEKGRQIKLLESAIKTQIKSEVLSNMKQNLYNISDSYMENSSNMVISILKQCNTSYGEMKSVEKEIEQYMERVEKIIVI